MIRILLILLLAFLTGGFIKLSYADTITLKNGKVLKGIIVEKKNDLIKFDQGLGFTITYYLDELIGTNKEAFIDAKDVKTFEPEESAKEMFERGFTILDNYQGDWVIIEEARRIFQDLLVLYPNSAYGFVGWSKVYQKAAYDYGIGYNKEEIEARALPTALNAVGLDNSLAITHLQLADIYRVLEEFKNAEKEVNIAISIGSENPRYYLTLGDIFRYQGKKYAQKSINAYQKALNLEPSKALTVLIFKYLGNVYHNDLNKYQEATEYYMKALAIREQSPWIYSDLGLSLKRLGKNKKALKAFERSNKLSFQNRTLANILFMKGKIAEEEKDYDSGIRHYLERINIGWDSSYDYNKLGYFYRIVNDHDSARKYLKLAIKKDNKNVYAYYNLAVVDKEQKKYKAALKNINKAINVNDDYAPNYFQKGEILKLLNRREKSLNAYREYMRLEPNSKETVWLRSNVPDLKYD